MEDLQLVKCVSKEVINDFNAAMKTSDQCMLEKILANNSELIHPKYRNLDISTISQYFLKLRDFLHPFPRIPRKWTNEIELQMFIHFILIASNFKVIDVVLASANLRAIELLLENAALFKNTDGFDTKFFHSHIIRMIFHRKISNPSEKLGLVLKYVPSLLKKNLLINLAHGEINRSEDINKVGRLLLQMGCEVNNHGHDWEDPLMVAIEFRKTDVAMFLIENGAHLNIKAENTHQPLHHAITFHHDISLIEKMIQKGADMNVFERGGYTALHNACIVDRGDFVELLLKKGADITLKDPAGRTSFTLALAFLTPDNYNKSVLLFLLIQELAKAKFEGREIPSTDLKKLTDLYIDDWYTECCVELEKMKNTIFHPPYSYYDVLNMRNDKKSIKKLANLLRNEDFINNFKIKLHLFSIYDDDLMDNYKEAEVIRDKYLKLELTLKSAVGEYIPTDLIKSIIDFIGYQDLPVFDDSETEDGSSVM